VCSIFSKKKKKKKKSPSSMKNVRFHLPKYRGKVQKMGVFFTHSPKISSPSSNFQK
jgi:hypothetical protein